MCTFTLLLTMERAMCKNADSTPLPTLADVSMRVPPTDDANASASSFGTVRSRSLHRNQQNSSTPLESCQCAPGWGGPAFGSAQAPCHGATAPCGDVALLGR